jgi:hypothetical protein
VRKEDGKMRNGETGKQGNDETESVGAALVAALQVDSKRKNRNGETKKR